MLTLIIHRDSESSEAPVFLILPASRWDIADAKARLRVDDLNECFFEYESPDDLPQAGNILKNMWREQNFWGELNYFTHLISEMSHTDRILFNGAIAIHAPEDMKTLINLTCHLDDIVLGEAGSDEELGRFLINNGQADFPDEVIPFLDFSKIGEQHRANHSCAFDRNIYYEDLNPEIEEVYDGRNLPELPDWMFKVELRNLDHRPDDAFIITMELPATQGQIDDAMRDLEADGINEIEIIRCESRISDLPQFKDADLAELDNFAMLIHRMSEDTYVKFMAVAEHLELPARIYEYGCRSEIGVYNDIIYELDNYDFTPKIRPEDIGSYGLIRGSWQEQTMAHNIEPEWGEM